MLLFATASAAIATLSCIAAEPHSANAGSKSARSAAQSPIVVELFTSEGCSSCPPADKLASEIAKDRDQASRPIVLAFHVDYWDRLGWKDRFASPEASARQRRYVDALTDAKSEAPPPVSVYTPQMVINGSRALVGSDQPLVNAEIKRSAGVKSPADALSVKCSRNDDKLLLLTISFAPPADKATSLEALACVVENGLTSKVARGENSGRTLHHDRVVRSFITAPLTGAESKITLALPADLKPANARVVVVVQHAAHNDRSVVAAVEWDFPEAATGK